MPLKIRIKCIEALDHYLLDYICDTPKDTQLHVSKSVYCSMLRERNIGNYQLGRPKVLSLDYIIGRKLYID